jgi:isovaleryl-CoA dehydrogenase
MSFDAESFRTEVRSFATTHVAPLAASIDADNEFPADLWLALGRAGLLGITVDPRYGGRGYGYTAHLIAMEEISRASASVGLSYIAHSNLCMDNLYRHGTASQREHYLPRLCSGELVGALAISEPGAGSDVVGSLSCKAESLADGWCANGTKKWITNGPEAGLLIVYMRTLTTTQTPALTALLIDAGLAGFSRGPRTNKLGMRGSNTCALLFSDCHIAASQVLGKAHEGTRQLMHGLDTERLLLAAGPLGIMQAALDLVLPYVRSRQQFGQPIGTFELMQAKLADMYVAHAAARALAYTVAEQFDSGRPSRKNAAAALLCAAEAAVKVALEAIQCLGAPGYMNESPAGRLLRDAKLYEIGGGTNEIRRILIGRELYEHGVESQA